MRRPLGDPLHAGLNLVERALAQRRLVHGDEPLRGGTEDDRLLAAPAMRVAVADVLVQQQHAAFAQPLDDMRVGLVDLHAAPGAAGSDGIALVEAPVVVDGHDQRHAEL